MLDFKKREESFVDAIEEGRIVKVSEYYAKREGLLILRKSAQISAQSTPAQKKDEEQRNNRGFIGMEDLRKPLGSRGSDLLKELVENFHWILVRKRKDKMITRKKLASEVGESELSIRMIESGVLPANNFVLVNKLESYYGVTLRKNKSVGTAQPLRQIIDFNKSASGVNASSATASGSGARTPRWASRFKKEEKKEDVEIEIIDDDFGDNGKKKDNSAGKSSSSTSDDSDVDIIQL